MYSMLKSVCGLVLTGGLLGIAPVVLSAVPGVIDYQGVLYSDGVPVSTTVSVQFTIYNAEVIGDTVWTETRSITPDSTGVFTVLLGESVPLSTNIFDTPDLWLAVTVGAEPELSPRAKLATAPWAFKVGTVDGAVGGSIGSDLSIQGTVAVQGFKLGSSATPGEVLTTDADGIGTWQPVPTNGGGITEVIAGDGLTGGGAESPVTLNVGSGSGIAVSADQVSLAAAYQDGSAHDGRFVNEGQSSSINSSMIVNETVTSADIQNGAITTADLGFTPGDITAVYSGSGLTGGGSLGSVTLSVGSEAINSSHVYKGYVDLQSYQMIDGYKHFNDPLDVNATCYADKFYIVNAGNHNAVSVRNSPTENYPAIWAECNTNANALYGQTGDYIAIYGLSNSTTYAAVYANNASGNTGYINGVYARVPGASYYGIGTNGRGYFEGGTAVFTSLETSRGKRMMTSPLVPEIQVYLSGSSGLINGKMEVHFDSDLAEMVATSEPFKVILTPTAMCNGLAVTSKEASGFTVEELANGVSAATFDWFVIAAKATSLALREAEQMPTVVPQVQEPTQAAQSRNPGE